MSMPEQRPYRSEQTVETPKAFMDAIESRFGAITFDLAANADNTKAPLFYTEQQDSLAQRWDKPGVSWLNPPYSNIGKWAKKCCESTGKILMLVPASIGSNWFRDYVFGHAMVLAVSPRLTFVGHTSCYPKDLILCGYRYMPGFSLWDWKE